VQAVRDSDQAAVDEMIVRLSRSRPWLAPLALAVGAFAMLLDGVRLLFTNWRLTLIQVLPAMWIWAAMYDLKAHVLRGKSFHDFTGPGVEIPLVLGIAAVTAASFYLNAVFAFAIISPGHPRIRPAFTQARAHLPVVLAWGVAVGILLGLATVVVPRWGRSWFAVSLSIVVGLMMVCYVAVPAGLIGIKSRQSKRDKMTATVVGGVVGAIICTPPYVLGRIGLILLGSHELFVLGGILFAIGLTLQAGATGAVKTVKMSAKLVSGNRRNNAAGDAGQERKSQEQSSLASRGKKAADGASGRMRGLGPGAWRADQLDQPENHEQEDDEQDHGEGSGLAKEDEDQRAHAHRPDPQHPAVPVGPLADRPGGYSLALAEEAEPGQPRPQRRPRPDRRGGGPGEVRPDGDDKPHRQHDTQAHLEEVQECVVHRGGGVPGKHVRGHALEIDAAGDQQADGEDKHGRGQPEAGADQRAPAAPRDPYPGPEKDERNDGQHDLERGDQPVERLGLAEVLRLEQRYGRRYRRDVVCQREPARHQVLLGRGDERTEVQDDLAVAF
jgi:hypothetical protein